MSGGCGCGGSSQLLCALHTIAHMHYMNMSHITPIVSVRVRFAVSTMHWL